MNRATIQKLEAAVAAAKQADWDAALAGQRSASTIAAVESAELLLAQALEDERDRVRNGMSEAMANEIVRLP